MTGVAPSPRSGRRLTRLVRTRPGVAVAALIIAVLFAVAALAPFLSQDRPLWLEDGDAARSPLVAGLTTEDVLWLGALVGTLAAYVASRIGQARGRATRAIGAFAGCAIVATVVAGARSPSVETRRYYRELELRTELADLDRRAGEPGALDRYVAFVERVGTDSLLVVEEAEERIAVLEDAPPDAAPHLARTAGLNRRELDRLEDAIFPPNPHAPGAPSFVGVTRPGDHANHRLGTDAGGRDLLAQLIHGARHSLTVALVAALLAALAGLAIGALAGYTGGTVDWTIQRLIEIVSCLPALFILIVLVAYLPPDVRDRSATMIAFLTLVLWPHAARLVRVEVQRIAALDFVVAARALGASPVRVLLRHVVPNAVTPLIQNTTLTIGAIVLLEASLSFLGLGPPARASWGRILDEARRTGALGENWHLAVLPGAAVFLTVLAFNVLGDAVRDARDPREVVV